MSKTAILKKKKTKITFQDHLLLNTGQKYCRILQEEHSAILSTSLSFHLRLRSLFCLFLSGRLITVHEQMLKQTTFLVNSRKRAGEEQHARIQKVLSEGVQLNSRSPVPILDPRMDKNK